MTENWNYDHASLYSVVVEQKLVENLYFSGGWFLADSDSLNRNINNPPVLEVDVNQFLLDGRPNPYDLRPFVLAVEPTMFRSPVSSDTLRAQLAYELDMKKVGKGWTKWLGHHRMLGYYERRHVTDGTFRYREAIIDPNHAWLQPPLAAANSLNYTNGAALDRPAYRYYVGPTGALGYTPGYNPPKSGVTGTFNLNYNNPTNNSWVSEPAVFGTAPYITTQTRQEITSRGAVLQSSFWDNRLVYTGGIRTDFNRNRTSNGAVDNTTTGFYDYGAISTYGPWSNSSGRTVSNSFVLRVLPWLGLSYDRSDSFQPQTQAVDLYDVQLPNSDGRGQDWGAFVNLFGNKLVVGIKIYHNDQINIRNANSTLGSRIARLEDGDDHTVAEHENFYDWATGVVTTRLGADRQQPARSMPPARRSFSFRRATSRPRPTGEPIGGVNSVEAKGAELDLTFNPTNQWNIKVTGAETDSVNTALENDIQSYLAQRLPVCTTAHDDSGNLWWTQNIGGTVPEAFYTTSILAPLEIDQSLLGKSNPQIKKYSARGLTNYRFYSGWLKHVGVGGSARWNDRSVLGYEGAAPDPDGIVRSLDKNKPVYDPSRFTFELWASL